ncbi:hypothetical protein HNQ35_000043 [Cerasibacillus quisquiliarum]|nr:hypothetical protein [Cerasibacillus quisquiliarum]MBB5144854.1 hypothetical protein [Cerasibacillus quisquiliarum]
MRGRKRIWMLLYRYEEGHKVWLYEPLRKYEITARLRDGWKIVT